jgi:hypothetical protein
MVKHLIEDESGAEKGNEGKPLKVKFLKDIGEGEKGEGEKTQSKPSLVEERRLQNLLLCGLLKGNLLGLRWFPFFLLFLHI